MKTIVRISLAAVAVAVFANAASAQLPTLPVYTSPGGFQGLMISGDWGMGMNDDAKSYGSSDSPMAFGGAVGYGAKMFNISALVGYLDHKNAALSKPISFGGNVGVTVLQKPESPLAINVFGGVGYTSLSLETGGSLGSQLNVPFGVGIGFSPPSSGSVSFQVWGAPRGNWVQESPEVGESSSEFGFGGSAGVNVNFAQGFGIHAAFDFTSFSVDDGAGGSVSVSPMVVGAGLHYNFKMPGAGSGT